MYDYEVFGEVVMRGKGVATNCLRKTTNFNHYKDILFGKLKVTGVETRRIQSKKHELYSVQMQKTALTGHDDKRYVKEDNITTLPWGHKDVPVTFKWKVTQAEEDRFREQVTW